MPQTIGPRLSDAAFFAELDSSRAGLAALPELLAQKDYDRARQVFAADVRASLVPERFFQLSRGFGSQNVMLPGESLAQAAERILRLRLVSCSTPHQFEERVDWFYNPTSNHYKEWTWQLSRHSEWGILAERYRETADERLAEGFVALFKSWVRQALVPEDAPSNATKCWRTIEMGIRMAGSWPWALHSFYQSAHMTDDVIVDWYKSVWEHGQRLRHVHHSHNWLIMEQNGLAHIGILYPQFKRAAAWKAFAFEVLVRELDTQVYPDGFQYELSTNYHQVNIRNYQWLWDLCEAYDEDIPEAFRTGLERMHSVNVMIAMPDRRLPDTNDGKWLALAPLMSRAAACYPQVPEFLWAATDGKQGRAPETTSHSFDYAGFVISRSDWSQKALWLMLDAGPFGYAHQHEDKLNLLMHAYGRLLLTEAGNYAYDDSEMRRYVLSSRAHNTIRIDGYGQNRRRDYMQAVPGLPDTYQGRQELNLGQAADIRYQFLPSVDLIEASYDEGYGPQAAQMVSHQRRLLVFKQGYQSLPPFALVIDRLFIQDALSHEAEILWHFGTDSALAEGLSVHSQDDGKANLSLVVAEQAGLRLELIRGQESPEWQGWKAIKDHQQGQFSPAPTARFLLPFTTNSRLVTFLFPRQIGQTCPLASVMADANVTAREIDLVLISGEAISLNEQDYL